jgi:hypothetical protein
MDDEPISIPIALGSFADFIFEKKSFKENAILKYKRKMRDINKV